MSIAASGFVLGFLLATAYGAAFHFIVGGPARQILLYILASWVGFTIGHFLGYFINLELFKLGTLHLFSASLGAWMALVASHWFVSNES